MLARRSLFTSHPGLSGACRIAPSVTLASARSFVAASVSVMASFLPCAMLCLWVLYVVHNFPEEQ
ncbi:uncharacterized, partial [Tachysurus ichikawai]